MSQLPHPPRPHGSKLLLALRFRKNPFSLLSSLRARYGDAFSLALPGLGDWICLCSPDLAEELYQTSDDLASASDFNSRFLTPVMGKDSFVAEDGDRHKSRRSALTAFFNGKCALAQTELIRRVVERRISSWRVGQELRFFPNAMQISLESNYRIITGIAGQARLDELVKLTAQFFDAAMKTPLITMPFLQIDLGRFSPWGRILWLRERLRNILGEEIRNRASGSSGSQVTALDALLQFNTTDGLGLSLQTILDDLLIILNAGQETSSRILSWTLAGVLAKPGAYQKLRAELDSVVGNRPIQAEDLSELPYLDAVIQEGIRYRPFSPLTGGRVVREPFPLGKYLMPKGALVVHAHAEVCMRGDLFPNPGEFDPDSNFLGRKFSRGQWAPFGGGPRLCLGRGLALVQLKVLLASIFQRLDLELCQEPIRAVPSGFLFMPENGLPVRITARR